LDVQVISVAAGLLCVAVAAFGLLITWNRREENKQSKGRPQGARRMADKSVLVSAGVGIGVFALVGVGFTFWLGVRNQERSPSNEPLPSESSPIPLSVEQYRSQLSQSCTEAKEQAKRIEETTPTKTVLGVEIKIEQDQLSVAKSLRPPPQFKAVHEDMIAVSARRISVLQSIYARLDELTDDELESALQEADQLANQLAVFYTSLGVPECKIM
jgi:hypothetical protein